jgi:exopolyphosphatase / guanosine-5'-triphosphate,3'-diphosphate pyrophosphatase
MRRIQRAGLGLHGRFAVIDLGSNSFRMEIFSDSGEGSWEREHDTARAVRVGEGLSSTGRLGQEPIERALLALEEFASVCHDHGLSAGAIDAVATSAIRDAENGRELLDLVRDRAGLEVRVLTREQEARYGYLAAVNSTALTDGCVLDLGGGSLQLVRVGARLARETVSKRLGAVRMTERFLDGDGPATHEQLQALRAHVTRKLAHLEWLSCSSPHLVGLGGTVRNLAAATATARAQGLPAGEVHGFSIRASQLDELIERLAALPARERGSVAGIKANRADIVLAGAVVVREVMRAGGFSLLEVSAMGLREGVFFERQLAECRLDGLLAPRRVRAA